MMEKKTECSYVHNNKEWERAKRGMEYVIQGKRQLSEISSINLHKIRQPTKIYVSLRMCYFTWFFSEVRHFLYNVLDCVWNCTSAIWQNVIFLYIWVLEILMLSSRKLSSVLIFLKLFFLFCNFRNYASKHARMREGIEPLTTLLLLTRCGLYLQNFAA